MSTIVSQSRSLLFIQWICLVIKCVKCVRWFRQVVNYIKREEVYWHWETPLLIDTLLDLGAVQNLELDQFRSISHLDFDLTYIRN